MTFQTPPQIIRNAIELDQNGEYDLAYEQYLKGLEWLSTAIKYEVSTSYVGAP